MDFPDRKLDIGVGVSDGSTSSNENHQSAGQCTDIIVYNQTKTVRVSKDLLKDNRVISENDDDKLLNLYKILRTKVLQRMQHHGVNTLAITSPRQGGGKTLTAINLGLTIAKDVNYSVLFVDLDLKRPILHNYFGLAPDFGLSDYILDDVPLEKMMINPGIERVVILPGGNGLPQSSEMLSAPNMVRLFAELKSRYTNRIIIFDLPPLLISDDALVFMPQADAGLLVVENGVNTPDEVRQSVRLMERTHFLGTVLNKGEVGQ